jgi:hypothetical protein
MKLPILRFDYGNPESKIKNRREHFTRDEQKILYHALVSTYETMDKETRKTAKFLIRELFV